jgi:hypothetical protein
MMETQVWLDTDAGRADAITHTYSENWVFGFTGSVGLMYLTGDNRVLGTSGPQAYGVDARGVFFKRSSRTDPWTHNLDPGAAAQVGRVLIIHSHAPRQRLGDILREIGEIGGSILEFCRNYPEICEAIGNLGQSLEASVETAPDDSGSPGESADVLFSEETLVQALQFTPPGTQLQFTGVGGQEMVNLMEALRPADLVPLPAQAETAAVATASPSTRASTASGAGATNDGAAIADSAGTEAVTLEEFSLGPHVQVEPQFWGVRIYLDHEACQAQDEAFSLPNLIAVGIPLPVAGIIFAAKNMILANDRGNGVYAFVTWAGVHWFLPA